MYAQTLLEYSSVVVLSKTPCARGLGWQRLSRPMKIQKSKLCLVNDLRTRRGLGNGNHLRFKPDIRVLRNIQFVLP